MKKTMIKRDRNQEILSQFPPQNSWEENYRKIIHLGKKLPPFPAEDRLEKWQIKACQSPLWLKAELSHKGRALFSGDSEGLISKGLLALIITFYSERSPKEILQAKPEFVEKLELSQYLSARRSNGLSAVLDQVLQYAKVFLILSGSPSPPSPLKRKT